jgi:hypothetical protein
MQESERHYEQVPQPPREAEGACPFCARTCASARQILTVTSLLAAALTSFAPLGRQQSDEAGGGGRGHRPVAREERIGRSAEKQIGPAVEPFEGCASAQTAAAGFHLLGLRQTAAVASGRARSGGGRVFTGRA